VSDRGLNVDKFLEKTTKPVFSLFLRQLVFEDFEDSFKFPAFPYRQKRE